jgi:glutamate-1-semialdehyde 2,1-aminomutase
VPYNDPEALSVLLGNNENVAAFILEPVLGNVGPILPDDNYLAEVRKITEEHDVLLIFDEVITGYRLGIGGAQVTYGITPDLTTFGKIIGGGLPIGCFSGRRDIMQLTAPAGPVYQAGTFSGNPLSLSAGIACLGHLRDNRDVYSTLAQKAQIIGESIPSAQAGGFVHLGSMFKLFFRNAPPQNYREAKESDTKAFSVFWNKMMKKGIFLPPSQFETNFLSVAHSDEDVATIAGAYAACL